MPGKLSEAGVFGTQRTYARWQLSTPVRAFAVTSGSNQICSTPRLPYVREGLKPSPLMTTPAMEQCRFGAKPLLW